MLANSDNVVEEWLETSALSRRVLVHAQHVKALSAAAWHFGTLSSAHHVRRSFLRALDSQTLIVALFKALFCSTLSAYCHIGIIAHVF